MTTVTYSKLVKQLKNDLLKISKNDFNSMSVVWGAMAIGSN